MKRKRLHGILALGVGSLLVAGTLAQASPLQRGDVPAEPMWVLHVDVDGLRATSVGAYIMGELDKPEAQARFAVFKNMFNFDPRTQLHGVTLYSTGMRPEEGVLLVYAEFEPERLVTLAKAANDYQSTTHKSHVIHSWIDENKKARNGVKPRAYAALVGSRVVIFGQREATVAKALDVVDQAVPTLASSRAFPQLSAGGTGAFVQGATRKLELPSADPNAALFRLSKMVSLRIGESQKQVTATLNLEANDEEVAGNMASVGQGLLSLMKLQKEKPEATKVAEALSLKQDGATLVATFSMTADGVIELMKADAARKAKKSSDGN